MNLQSVINSPGMWIASSIMVIVVIVQSLLFMRVAFERATQLNIPRSECIRGMRSAVFTALGPSMGPVIVMLALLAIVGAPTTWMRMNDVGACRAELAMVSMSAQVAGVTDLHSEAFDLRAFSFVIWGMALNNLGWMAFALISVSRMDKAIKFLNEKSDPQWIKMLLGGAIIGLFAYLLSPSLLKGGGNIAAAAVSFAAMSLISRYLGKHRRLQEFALGIAMLAGMFAGAAYE